MANRFRERVATHAIVHQGASAGSAVELRVTASAGVAQLRGQESETSLLERADAALYEVKAGGRNQVRLAAEL